MFYLLELIKAGRQCRQRVAACLALVVPAAFASPPIWLANATVDLAWRVTGAGPQERNLLGTGDTLLARLPASGASAAQATPAENAGPSGDKAPCLYQIWRGVPAGSPAASGQTLVRPLGLARLMSISPPPASLAVLQLIRAVDAVQPDDLLLPLDSPSATSDTAARSPSLCTSHDPR